VAADGTGKCAALRRMSLCLACDDPNCGSVGTPCHKTDSSIGACTASTTPCQHDCDCVKIGQVCDIAAGASSGQCAPLRRMSNCLSCKNSQCKRGDPCLNDDGSLGSCCCDVAGCPTGQLCCSGGAQPPPGICGRFCTQPAANGGCPLFP
jgi:hypothetical protein